MDTDVRSNNVPVARAPFVAAIRGPVVLITLGALFALDYSAGIGFGKTWPILLIVVGLLHLIGRVGAGRAEDGHVGVNQP